MTDEIPLRPLPSREQELENEGKRKAYANLLDRTDRDLEIQFNGEWYYITSVDGTLYMAQNNDEPEKMGIAGLELLLTGERVELIDRGQCHEFEGIHD